MALSEKSARSSGQQRCDIGSDGQQATVAVAESEGAMGLRRTHAVLKKRVVINSRRSDFFVGPTVKDRHDSRFYSPSQPCFLPAVITHPSRNLGKWFRHKRKV